MMKNSLTSLQALALSLGERGEKPALCQFVKGGSKSWSFAELGDCSRKLAAGLAEAGIQPGSHVVLFAPNGAEWVIACMALLRAGMVPVPIDAQMGSEEYRAVMRETQARWIFTSTTLAGRASASKNGQKHELIFLDEDDDERSWRHFLSDRPFDLPPVNPEDRAVVFYTSGTSGAPKGVPLTHRNIASNVAALLELELIRDDDRLLLPLPLHHVYPFTIGMLTPLAVGVPIVLPFLLTGPQFQRALREGRATAIIGVPRLYEAFYAAIESKLKQRSQLLLGAFKAALKSAVIARRYLRIPLGRYLFASVRRQIAPDLRMLASGGAAMDKDLAEKLDTLGWQLASGYGLTETSPLLTFNAPGEARGGTAGKPLPGVTLKIEKAAKDTSHGEVLAKGPNVFSGYLGKEKKEQEVFDDEGFFRTGDLGFVDDDGYLHLVGRSSSMIVLSEGENIWPEKIESALEQSERIREAGVFSRDDHLAAVLVIESAGVQDNDKNKEEREAAIRSEVEQRLQALPSHYRIAEYAISSESMPRTRLGKLQRHKLAEVFDRARRDEEPSKEKKGRAEISELAPEDQTLLQDPAARAVWEWVGARFTDVQLSPQLSIQRDLGVDSMDWLNLTLEIRARAGVDLDDEAIGRIDTVRDLLQEVAEAGPAAETEAGQWLERPQEFLSERQRSWLHPPGRLRKLTGELMLGVNRLFMHAVYRLEVRGRENIPDDGPFIVTPNHTSFLDPLALGAALPRGQLRHTYWGGWTGIMFNNPVMRFISRAVHVVPVDPERGPLSALAFGVAALRARNNLVWFPEGGRSKDGTLQPFRPGIGILLTASAAPALPVYIHGTLRALPVGRWWPRRGRITVTFGTPFYADRSGNDRARQEKHQRIADALRDRVAALEQAFHG